KLEYFRRHSSQFEGDMPWVGASGVKGLTSITIARGLDAKTAYACESLAQAFSPLPVGPAFWPTSLGQVGLSALPIQTKPEKPEAERLYTVRLYFREPDTLKPGQRIFSVAVAGQVILKDLDVAKETVGTNRSLMKEFKGIKMGKELIFTFTPSAKAKIKETI